MGLLFSIIYMNKTKKLTTGAMLLAIVGALMLIDRQLSFFFEELIIMLAPAIIVMYAAMYDVKDGLILSVSLLVIGFLLGSSYTYIYLPISVIVGVGYSIGLKKNLNKSKLMIIAMALFVLGEIIATFIITPILGISIADQIKATSETFSEFTSQAGYDVSILESVGINVSSLLLIALVVSTLLIGVCEGFIIHIFSLFLLARFKIKQVDKGSIISFNLNPIVAYISFISFGALMFIQKIDNETIKLIIVTLAMIGSMILLYYGYIFVILYLRLVTGKKAIGFVVILVILFTIPISLIALIIFGFLYGAGPFKSVLEAKGLRQ